MTLDPNKAKEDPCLQACLFFLQKLDDEVNARHPLPNRQDNEDHAIKLCYERAEFYQFYLNAFVSSLVGSITLDKDGARRVAEVMLFNCRHAILCNEPKYFDEGLNPVESPGKK